MSARITSIRIVMDDGYEWRVWIPQDAQLARGEAIAIVMEGNKPTAVKISGRIVGDEFALVTK